MQKRLYDEASASYAKKSPINFRTVVKYIPEVVKPATDILSPASYSAELLLKPFDYLVNWWRQRPFSKMYSLGKEVYEIHDYPDLFRNFIPYGKMTVDGDFGVSPDSRMCSDMIG